MQTETTSDTGGGGSNIGFIEDGDYTSYKPFNLTDITEVRFRVASAGPGGTIELRYDSPTGPLLGKTAMITPTGNWQTFKDVALPLTGVPGGHARAVRHHPQPGPDGVAAEPQLDRLHRQGRRADRRAGGHRVRRAADRCRAAAGGRSPPPRPIPTAGRSPTRGTSASPARRRTRRRPASPTYTYANQGTYTATLTVTDGQGGSTTKTFAIKVTALAGCGTTYRDDFDGTDLGAGWEVVRRDQNLVVSGGTLKIPTAERRRLRGPTNNAKNIVLRAAPSGPWTITTKIKHAGNRQYHQAGLIVYGDDDNYTKFDRLAVNTPTDRGERALRVHQRGRGHAAQRGGGRRPAAGRDLPDRLLHEDRVRRDADPRLLVDRRHDLDARRPARQPADRQRPPRRVRARQRRGHDRDCGVRLVHARRPPVGAAAAAGDEFNGTTLDKTRWNGIVREDTSLYKVADGGLTLTTVQSEIAPTNKNYILQTADHTSEDWVLEAKLSAWTLSNSFQQAGIVAWLDDNNYVKFNAISDNNNTRINRSENRSNVAGTIIQPQPQVNVPAGVTAIWLRLTKSGTNYQGEISYDGTTWTGGRRAGHQPDGRSALRPLHGRRERLRRRPRRLTTSRSTARRAAAAAPNTPPVITTATATPSSGFAPLAVGSERAPPTTPNGDTLTYSWDFDGNGTADATGATANTTFTTAGAKTVKLTVSDGKGGTATRDIPVQVLAADDANAKLRALVFTKTAGFRHDSIEAGTAAVKTLGTQKNWQVDSTDDASLFTDAVLAHYDVVIFMSTTGDTLNDTQQAAFERFIRSGKGYVGIHAAADGEYDWRWYGNLVGAYFRNHPAGTPTATVVVEDTTDPSTAGLPARWSRTDEWYNYKAPTNANGDDYSARSTPGVHVLLKMDESTYAEDDGSDGVDDDHPISWCQKYDGGRSWYTGLGHTQASFSEAGHPVPHRGRASRSPRACSRRRPAAWRRRRTARRWSRSRRRRRHRASLRCRWRSRRPRPIPTATR